MCGSWVQYRTDVRTCQEANRPEARGGATAPILRQAMEEVGMAQETLSRWHWLRVIAARAIPAPATIHPPRGCSWRGLEGRPTGGQELGSGSHNGRARQGLFPAGTEQDTSAVRRAGGHACPGLSSVRAAQMRWPMTAPMELWDAWPGQDGAFGRILAAEAPLHECLPARLERFLPRDRRLPARSVTLARAAGRRLLEVWPPPPGSVGKISAPRPASTRPKRHASPGCRAASPGGVASGDVRRPA